MSSYRDTKDWDSLHGLDPAGPQVPIENCPTHGAFEFNLWTGCPGCADDDDAAVEVAKRARFDRPHLPRKTNHAA